MNNPNDYRGPGTGYQIEEERWRKLSNKESAIVPENILEIQREITGLYGLYKSRVIGNPDGKEADIVIAVSPGFCDLKLGVDVCKSHLKVLQNIFAGIEKNGMSAQIIKVYSTADLAEIVRETTQFSKFEISIAIQINGKVFIKDNRNNNKESVKGYYDIIMSSPEIYEDVGALAVAFAKDSSAENLRIPRSREITEYQLKMFRIPTDEQRFIAPHKDKEILRIDETNKYCNKT